MSFKKTLSRISVSEQVIDSIIDSISNGYYKAGDRLVNEREMAESFGISRVPLREAVRALNVLGVLESRQGDGTFISAYNPDILGKTIYIQSILTDTSKDEIFETRGIMESEAARLAAKNATPEDLDEIEKAMLKREESMTGLAGKSINKEIAFQTDQSFHRSIAKAAHNSYFLLYMDALFYSVKEQQLVALEDPESFKRASEYHRMVFNAIKNKNQELAYEFMKSHIEAVCESYKKVDKLKEVK